MIFPTWLVRTEILNLDLTCSVENRRSNGGTNRMPCTLKYIDTWWEFSLVVLSYTPKVTVCPKVSVDGAREWVGGLPCHWGLRLERSHYSLSEASSEWLGDRSEPANEKHMCSTRHWRSSRLISLAYSLALSQPFPFSQLCITFSLFISPGRNMRTLGTKL